MQLIQVKLEGAASITTPFGERWKKGQTRVLREDDPNLPYYERKRIFNLEEVDRTSKRFAHLRLPADEPETGDVDPLATPPAPVSEGDDEPDGDEPDGDEPDGDEPDGDEPDGDEPDANSALDNGIPSDAELEKWNKGPLLDLATELGLAVDESMTKAEIRAEIDKRR